jgi:hypothetical protein
MLRDADSHYERSLHEILEGFIENGAWTSQDLDPVLGALLAIRFEAAADWARTHCFGQPSPIPYPAVPFRSFLRWLLNTWWAFPGRYHASELLQLMRLEELSRPVRKRRR